MSKEPHFQSRNTFTHQDLQFRSPITLRHPPRLQELRELEPLPIWRGLQSLLTEYQAAPRCFRGAINRTDVHASGDEFVSYGFGDGSTSEGLRSNM